MLVLGCGRMKAMDNPWIYKLTARRVNFSSKDCPTLRAFSLEIYE